MKVFMTSFIAISSAVVSAQTINLSPGESIFIQDKIIKCGEAQGSRSRYAQFSTLPQSDLIRTLRGGLGACKIEQSDGYNPQDFYSSNTYNGLWVTNNSMGTIRSDIKNGGCD